MGDRSLLPSSEIIYDWTYRFEDGTRLVGRVKGKPAPDRCRLLDPEPLDARYLDRDGKTVSIRWHPRDFIAFDLGDSGKDVLIVASNDNCTQNSLCLVSGFSRSRAQITDEGLQVVGESFHSPSWSVKAEASANEPVLRWGWSMSPYFPFLSLRFDLQSTTSRKIYRWTVSPYLPFYALVEIAEAAT